MEDLESIYPSIKNNSFLGCYLTLSTFLEALGKEDFYFKKDSIGLSEKGRNIFSYTWGIGSKRILMWSQMHGDEPTTTKALLDLFNYLNHESGKYLQDEVTLCIIPVLNPDGAYNYSRMNANGVDLNRDAQNKTQRESCLLLETYKRFKPDYCFNLHQQPTVHGISSLNASSILSFLIPSADEKKELNPEREEGMRVISHIFKSLNRLIPNRMSRYNDDFNLNCFGDTFQSLGTPTLLFEAGYDSEEDYAFRREKVREMIFYSIIKALEYIVDERKNEEGTGSYFEIPNAERCFHDVIIRNIPLWQVDNSAQKVDLAIQYKGVLKGSEIKFIPTIEKLGKVDGFYRGHAEIDYNSNKPISIELLSDELLSVIKIPEL